ncbi:hypothetical protein ACO2Q8_04975 [Larkinella sp. VNQ87]
MEIALCLGLSFVLLWLFKQRREATQKQYLFVGIGLLMVYLVARLIGF